MAAHKKLLGVVAAVAVWGAPALADDQHPGVEILQSTTETVIGQPFAYPEGQAKITGVMVTMTPGQSTGWHHHNAPIFGYILEGELTVDYGADGTRIYRAGDSLVEAFGTPHNGTNTGSTDMRLIAVFAGAEGVANTVSEGQ